MYSLFYNLSNINLAWWYKLNWSRILFKLLFINQVLLLWGFYFIRKSQFILSEISDPPTIIYIFINGPINNPFLRKTKKRMRGHISLNKWVDILWAHYHFKKSDIPKINNDLTNSCMFLSQQNHLNHKIKIESSNIHIYYIYVCIIAWLKVK